MNASDIKHTPLQWGRQELECFKTDTAEWVVATKGDVIAVIERIGSDEEQKAKAESLVTAVNSHHALQARVKELEEALKEAADKLESLSHIHDGNPSDALAGIEPVDYARHMLGEARQMAREAHRDALSSLPHPQGVVEIDAYEPVLYVQPDVISSTLLYPIKSRKMATKIDGWNGCTVPLYAKRSRLP